MYRTAKETVSLEGGWVEGLFLLELIIGTTNNNIDAYQRPSMFLLGGGWVGLALKETVSFGVQH